MTLAEKVRFVNLRNADGYENINTGVPRLCIPALTLQDGPNGISNGATGVTQLPASLGMAASFDTGLAYRYGQVEGEEARGKGIDVVQGPELNLDRVPESGRAFEAFGEDPYLTAAMGVADIEGIQSAGVMADAKHYSAYNQETARFLVDQVISQRALAEIYQLPFQAAVDQGHVASIMCSYGSLNGVNSCSSPYLYRALKAWGFVGFVRSDLDAVEASVPAFTAGMSVIKPEATAALINAVLEKHLDIARLNDAVKRVLAEMFAFGFIGKPPTGKMSADVATKAHARFALAAAEGSMVLLKDTNGVLPLVARHLASVAVIGEDAVGRTMSAGYGSARVRSDNVVTPLAALRAALSPHVKVTYEPGGGACLYLPLAPPPELVASGALSSPNEAPALDAKDREGTRDLPIIKAPSVTPALATADAPGQGKLWVTWTATFVPPESGLYCLSLRQSGDTWLYVDGKVLIASPGLHAPDPWSTAVSVVAGRRYSLQLRWFMATPDDEPRLGLAYASGSIAAAVRAARAARVAVVFANDFNSEAVDRPGLSLPGDQNALIAAVAGANARTVVVLNTGGPVLMPWLAKVAAVVEAWYPGQQDGNAVTSALTGVVDPSGHLPVTFPARADQGSVRTVQQWPGVDGTVTYSEGLDIGYRYYKAHGLRPLFPFGFGLSYTGFSIADASDQRARNGITVEVRVTNTGHRSGTAVLQAYLSYPLAAQEPPQQLRAFSRVTLSPGHSKVVAMELPRSDFEVYNGNHFVTVHGKYTISLGQSSGYLPLTLSLSAP